MSKYQTAPFYYWHFGRLYLARSKRLERTSGFRRWKKTRLFWSTELSRRQLEIYCVGFADHRAQVVELIRSTLDTGAKTRARSWDNGFETALQFVEAKAKKLEPTK